MIVYLDSSVIVRALLPDEPDHMTSRELLDDPSQVKITGSWSVVEITGALTRATRAFRGDEEALFASFRNEIDPRFGSVTVVDAVQAEVEAIAAALVRRTGIRSLDAWHLGCAQLALDELAEPGETRGFATRDSKQASVAQELGFTLV